MVTGVTLESLPLLKLQNNRLEMICSECLGRWITNPFSKGEKGKTSKVDDRYQSPRVGGKRNFYLTDPHGVDGQTKKPLWSPIKPLAQTIYKKSQQS